MNRLQQIATTPSLCMALVCFIALIGLLTACGGGGDDSEEDKASNQPVNCQVNPEKCK